MYLYKGPNTTDYNWQKGGYVCTLMRRIQNISGRDLNLDPNILKQRKILSALCWIKGQCYNHNFKRFSPIYGEKIGVFLENQCFDPFFAWTSSFLNKNANFFRQLFWRKYFRNHSIGPWMQANMPSWQKGQEKITAHWYRIAIFRSSQCRKTAEKVELIWHLRQWLGAPRRGLPDSHHK
jgi:hypothetical protein